jgi:hypothetical protein
MAQLQYASVGPLAAASATNIRTASTFAAAGLQTLNGSTVVSGVAVLDAARTILFTFAGAEAGLIITVVGTGAGTPAPWITETIAGPAGAGTVASLLKYNSVISVTSNQLTAGTVSIGTNTLNYSGWIQFDRYAKAGVAVQLVVVGTVNYTLQQTLDDPNSTVNPVAPASVTWVNCADATVVGATANMQTNYAFPPAWVRVLLTSGTGSVAATFIQGG